MIEPTDLGLRSDAMGFGHYGASRGNRRHKGKDYLCNPGQGIRAPISGKLIEWGPYRNDRTYTGFAIESHGMVVKVWYCVPDRDLIGKYINAGDVVAVAQDITKKYSPTMKPHVHLEIDSIDPEILINLTKAMKGIEL